ncbi:phosphotransferase [Microbacterium sp. NEAU-LLC]|uniref:Phosphotransferase n=1 Tax=Microbacterium helvum TaxID=2773713 RepID=A0ABR8NM45_9MICO|nr:phosphotransferase [Microbacterium helvum]MBD3941733.1 phosphotransferase [Microbacterium helvum]
MARSPLTLAASVTSAIPGAAVVGVGELTEGTTGRYDAAVATLDDGRRVVVRVPADEDAATELAAEVRALSALTPGVRSLLPFRAPELLGEAAVGDARAVVVDFLSGYRVDAAHLPPGRGAATSLGDALAAVHALPPSVVKSEGLPARTPQQVRTDVSRLIDRAAGTRRLPRLLQDRWRRAVDADELWRFESAVVLDGAGTAAFLLEDLDGVPTVTGLLDWHGLSVGDPATDLQWLASAPDAAGDVFAAYSAGSGRAPDARVRDRARLYAELEFAKWLIHGHDEARDDIVADAVELLESLAAGVAGDDLVAEGSLGVDDALALLDRMPGSTTAAVDTSMHTDAYDPEELARWVADDEASGGTGSGGQADVVSDPEDPDARFDDAAGGDAGTEPSDELRPPEGGGAADRAAAGRAPDDVSTSPIVLPGTATSDGVDAAADAERASEAALRRWLTD